MRVQQFRAQVTADSRGHAVIVVPFDPDEAWGTRRPDLRAARIAEVVGLLADGIKTRPRA